MDSETRALLEIQLDNIVNLLNGEMKTYICADYTGKNWKKIEIIYEDEPI